VIQQPRHGEHHAVVGDRRGALGTARYGQVECWETQAAHSAEREVVRQAVSARPTVHQAFFGDWRLDVHASTFNGLHALRSGSQKGSAPASWPSSWMVGIAVVRAEG